MTITELFCPLYGPFRKARATVRAEHVEARTKRCRGISLVELLTAMTISTIALSGLAVPFLAERTFWLSGESQAEAQRDAQLALRAMALVARESNGHAAFASGDQIIFANPYAGCSFLFQGGQNFGGRFQVVDVGCTDQTTVLIDGNRSVVTNFVVQPITPKLVSVQLVVRHRNRRNETLQTQIFLRN